MGFLPLARPVVAYAVSAAEGVRALSSHPRTAYLHRYSRDAPDRPAFGAGWAGTAVGSICFLSFTKHKHGSRWRALRQPARRLCTTVERGASSDTQRGAPLFELRTVCGRRSFPFAAATIHQNGNAPMELSVSAVSTTGLKGGGSINQDCIAASCLNDGMWSAVVVDGHGSEGHRCAARLCETLPSLVADAVALDGDRGNVRDALEAAFAAAEEDLERKAADEGYSVEFSGGAAAAMVMRPHDGVAYLVSCGDSQAMLVDMAAGTFKVSRPHKAHDSKERDRIAAAGGYVEIKSRGGELFSRVYPPSKTFGLAMSRSFGDLCVKCHGVTAKPSVITLDLPGEACCVLGSDGLFEFISPAEVVSTLQQRLYTHGAAVCAEALVEEARKRWIRTEKDYCDDISCLLIGPRTALNAVPPLVS